MAQFREGDGRGILIAVDDEKKRRIIWNLVRLEFKFKLSRTAKSIIKSIKKRFIQEGSSITKRQLDALNKISEKHMSTQVWLDRNEREWYGYGPATATRRGRVYRNFQRDLGIGKGFVEEHKVDDVLNRVVKHILDMSISIDAEPEPEPEREDYSNLDWSWVP